MAKKAVKTVEEAEAVAQAVAERTAERNRLQGEMNTELAEIQGKFQPQIAKLQKAIDDDSDRVVVFATKNRQAWTAAKSWKLLPFATIKASRAASQVEILVDSTAELIKRLKKFGFGSLVQKSEEKVTKTDLRKIPEEKQAAVGIAIAESPEEVTLVVDVKKFRGAQ